MRVGERHEMSKRANEATPPAKGKAGRQGGHTPYRGRGRGGGDDKIAAGSRERPHHFSSVSRFRFRPYRLVCRHLVFSNSSSSSSPSHHCQMTKERESKQHLRSGAQMGIFSGAGAHRPSCPSATNCTKWAQTYLKYCLCSTRDGMALTLGLLSVISWGVAEVPQIITNYKHKSTEGLSLAFLMTWIVGDFFNLVGCFLEPETLPTQFYMALLYTITTLILTGQTVYYSHIYHRLKAKKVRATSKPQRHQRADTSLREKLLGPKVIGEIRNSSHLGATVPIPTSSPITVNTEIVWHRHGPSSLSDYYYTSARSLSSSPVPMAGTWSANHHQTNSPPEIDDQKESLGSDFAPAQYAPSPLIKNSLSVVPWMALLLGMSVLHFLVGTTHQEVPNGIVIPVGRRLLLLADDHADSSVSNGSGSGIGSFLGWAMAVIYMGGRLPQIWLNMKRGNAEGLNPLMFTFALVGNVTYVGSILVKSMDWSKLKPNLPWLVDAGGCVLLDTFEFMHILDLNSLVTEKIILQFLYFHYRKQHVPDEPDSADKV